MWLLVACHNFSSPEGYNYETDEEGRVCWSDEGSLGLVWQIGGDGDRGECHNREDLEINVTLGCMSCYLFLGFRLQSVLLCSILF